jgi:hypothetical protein
VGSKIVVLQWLAGGYACVVFSETLWQHLSAVDSRDQFFFRPIVAASFAWLPLPPEIRHAGVRRKPHRHGRLPAFPLNDYQKFCYLYFKVVLV